MKTQRSKEWWLAKAKNEEGTIGAGLLARDPQDSVSRVEVPRASGSSVDETRIAFGRFINLMRRECGLSMENLADKAQLEVGELVNIEENLEYVPEPRTVYQLARTFNVPQRGLMQLAGLAVANDAGLREEAVRFAARSESMQKLSREEKTALKEFISVLSQGQK